MRVWRICQATYKRSSFSGDGGLYTPSRWHHKGHRVVYTSQSLSLVQLEVWVHEDPLPEPLKTYISVSADIPSDLPVRSIAESELPDTWRTHDPPPPALKDLGTEWLRSLSTAVAQVPSVITPGEFNYLLNPVHPDFPRIRPGEAQPFDFDRRMWKR